MIKKILALSLTAFVLMSFAACTDGGNVGDDTNATDTVSLNPSGTNDSSDSSGVITLPDVSSDDESMTGNVDSGDGSTQGENRSRNDVQVPNGQNGNGNLNGSGNGIMD